jgi:hypothetical protein
MNVNTSAPAGWQARQCTALWAARAVGLGAGSGVPRATAILLNLGGGLIESGMTSSREIMPSNYLAAFSTRKLPALTLTISSRTRVAARSITAALGRATLKRGTFPRVQPVSLDIARR